MRNWVKLLLLALIFSTGLILYVSSHYEDSFQLIQLTSSNENEYFCSWSPDSSKILYISNNQLWILDIKSKNKTQLTKEGKYLCGEFSPDGEKIAFVSINGDASNICVMDYNSRITRCFSGKGKNLNPQWSPDGTRIAFTRIDEFGRHIWVMNADGTNQTPLTHDLGKINCWNYDWSPDGKSIVFSTEVSGKWNIWIMDADGSNKKKISSGLHPKWVSQNEIVYRTIDNRLFSMTLDGKKELLAKDVGYYSISNYEDIVHDFGFNISIILQEKKVRLTKSGHDVLPVFSPDGKKIAFTSDRSGNFDVWLIVWI